MERCRRGEFETPLLPYLWVLSIAGKYRSRRVPQPLSRREAVHSCREKRAFSETKMAYSQLASALFQNPPFQPHILFSSRRKENVPLTVQEKRAAGGAVKDWFALPRTPC